MIDEQNNNTDASGTNDATGNETSGSGSTATSQAELTNDAEAVKDDYYEVDHAKKDVISTIGDGEMRDEGLADAGDVTIGSLAAREQTADEQDQAESQDREQ